MPYKDKEQQRKHHREYYQKNKERIRAQSRGYYQKYRDIYIARAAQWSEENKEKSRAIKRAWNYRLKIEVLTRYGNGQCVCVQCGENRPPCLSIDHINGNGADHKKKMVGPSHFYQWLKNNNWPLGFQTLCMNCQWIKRHDNKEYRYRSAGKLDWH